jgi:subtilisin family serine protease
VKRYFVLLAVIALWLAVLAPAGAASDATAKAEVSVTESSTGSYIVVMEADPLVSSFDQTQLNSPAAKNKAKGLKKGHDKVLKQAGMSADDKVNDYTVALNGFSAVMTYDEAKSVARQDGVALVLPDEMRYPTTDASATFLGLTDPAGPWATGYTGENVVVGVIDTGIWPEHPSFADDGSYSTLPIQPLDDSERSACDFGNTAQNPNDAPFECNNKLIGAREMLDTYRALIGADADEFDSARDDAGHGTHTASTAAGNSGVEASLLGIERGTISGMAPRARVIAYKALGNLGGFGSDLAAAIDQAVADGVDVINYSIGGGASLTGPDDIAFLFAADAGVFVATSAGNSGPGAATVGGPGSVPWITTVGASTQSRFFQGTAVLGDGSEYPGASITPGVGESDLVDAEDHGGDLCVPGSLDEGVAGKIVLCRRGAIDRVAKSLAVYEAGGAGMIMYNNSDDDNLFSDTHWVPSVHIDNTPGLAIKAYIASAASPTAEIIGDQYSEWAYAPSMTIFSSRGPDPVAEDIIKPDITAPGLQILAGYSPFPEEEEVPGQLFAAIAGTSMSSPHMAGVFALIKQAHPDWSPAAAKSAIMTTAYQAVVDNDRISQATPFDMGSGHLNPGDAVHKGSAFQPGLVYDAGFYEYLGFLCDAAPEVFADPAATCGFLESIGVPTDPSDLNLASIGVAELAGSQTVTRTVTSVAQESGWRTYNVSVDAPPGYDVAVSPSTLRLKSGQSASYAVTITNVTAPIGEWRFGSLTWSDTTGNYDVYSPIAVRGTLLGAPDAVSGSGTSGSGSFDVTFGYTGDYTALPHGLAADAPVLGDISQDPDQTYPSTDDGVGVDKIPFPISGSLFARWQLRIPGDDDIDLFLENSAGDIIASSTNGGTDELIEMAFLPDDTYTLVVHGWSVPHSPLDYTLHFWDVPLASGGGSLSVDSAPASAVIGTTGTIDFSWSGLTAGTAYLGAVSHNDAGGIIGVTLIDVDG